MRYHEGANEVLDLEEWGGAKPFFAATTDGGFVRVLLREGGQRFLESLQEPTRRTIGFGA